MSPRTRPVRRALVVVALVASASLQGCAARRPEVPATDALQALIALQDRQGACIDVYRARIAEAFDGVALEGDGPSVAASILEALPDAESAALTHAAARVGRIDRGNPDAETIPPVMAALRDGFARHPVCPIGSFRTDGLEAHFFADQLNVYLLERGLDTDRLFPPSGEWEGEQTLARLMVALVAARQARR